MGFSYADWSGVFYPATLPVHKRLGYYSRIFNAVEIDSTFYGTPRAESVRGWAASTPPEFRFSVKVPRQITHDAGLVGVQGELLQFIHTVQLLEDKLGAILFQFPPSFGPERAPALRACLAGLPGGVRYAVEIRHQSWYTAANESAGNAAGVSAAGVTAAGEPALAQMLREFGVCWAATEYPDLPRRIFRTADFLYLRWIGQHGAFQRHDQERIDRTAQLRQWWEVLQGVTPQISTVFGFFNNDYAGFAAGTANRFKEMTGLPAKPFQLPQQGTLF